ncbi:MAG: hypothetical protein KDA58_13460, partial [Planctomycetaceae bacterium]|nr:hypothetical protein [Planctomycetaceae bacterium]
MHLLQVCNVGNICGGTAACAWTTARALPNWQHTIWFLSPPTLLTRQEFAFAEVIHQSRITHAKLREIRPDLILWHNTSADRVPHGITIPSIQYQHSAGRRVPATQHVYCSRWLAQQCGDAGGRVLYQAVPLPARTSVARFSESCRIPLEPCTTDQVTAAQSNVVLDPVSSPSEWTIGRICTPKPHKWGPHLIPFYQQLAKEV